MKRVPRIALAVAAACVLNLVGVVCLTMLSASSKGTPHIPDEPSTEAPEIRALPDPPALPPQVTTSTTSSAERTLARVAPSELPTFSTLDSPNSTPVVMDHAIQESLDTFFEDLSRQPEQDAVGDALFKGRENKKAVVRDASQVDQAPTVRQRVDVRYPLGAEREGLTGHVVLRGLVEADGQVSRVDVIESSPSGVFDEAARSAFSQWSFEPGRHHGKPVRVWVRKRLEFRLQ